MVIRRLIFLDSPLECNIFNESIQLLSLFLLPFYLALLLLLRLKSEVICFSFIVTFSWLLCTLWYGGDSGFTVPSVDFIEFFLSNDQSSRVRSKDTRRKVPTFHHHIPWELTLPKQYIRIVLCFLLAYQKPNLLNFLLFISFTNMLYYVLLFSSFLNSSRYTFYRIHNSRKKISKPNQLFDWLED